MKIQDEFRQRLFDLLCPTGTPDVVCQYVLARLKDTTVHEMGWALLQPEAIPEPEPPLTEGGSAEAMPLPAGPSVIPEPALASRPVARVTADRPLESPDEPLTQPGSDPLSQVVPPEDSPQVPAALERAPEQAPSAQPSSPALPSVQTAETSVTQEADLPAAALMGQGSETAETSVTANSPFPVVSCPDQTVRDPQHAPPQPSLMGESAENPIPLLTQVTVPPDSSPDLTTEILMLDQARGPQVMASQELNPELQSELAMPAADLAAPLTMQESSIPQSAQAGSPASAGEITSATAHAAVPAPGSSLNPLQTVQQLLGQITGVSPPVLRHPPTLQLSNARRNQPYSHPLSPRSPEGVVVTVRAVRLPDGLGLQFDSDTQTLHGLPLQAGEFEVGIEWAQDQPLLRVPLVVNPDPRDLWQVKEPPAGSAFAKPHCHAEQVRGEGFELLAAGRRGRSHEHNGGFRDDDQHISFDPVSGFGVMMVADGAGSAEFSREGSRLAVQQVSQFLQGHLRSEEGQQIAAQVMQWDKRDADQNVRLSQFFYHTFQQALRMAVQHIEAEAQRFGRQARQFATTLLCSVFRNVPGAVGDQLFVASCWVGDGAIAVYGLPAEEPVRLLGVPDGGEYAGQTRFLDSSVLTRDDFHRRISIGLFDQPQALLLMTDGVSDPFFETEQQLRDPARWHGLWAQLQPLLATAQPAESVLEWLNFFQAGHHDDRTLAVWYPSAAVASQTAAPAATLEEAAAAEQPSNVCQAACGLPNPNVQE